jgi:flagellar biogenesis protein FliO
MAGGGKNNRIQVLESHYLGVKKAIALVKVPGSVLVVGLSADRVSLLSKIEEAEVLGGFEADAKTQPSGLSFRDQLRRFTGTKLFHNASTEEGIES